MTEGEANQKRCGGPVGTGTRLRPRELTETQIDRARLDNARWCIASECMMWRWELTREEAQEGRTAKNGYCGLAGNP